MIPNLDEKAFVEILHKHLSPTIPIQLEENLRGREKQLRTIQQALYAPGRSIFIHGDRGVGKTSLAQTVAFKYQSECDPVFVACSRQTTFGGLMSDVLTGLQQHDQKAHSKNAMSHKAKVSIPGLVSYEFGLNRPTQEAAKPIPHLDLNSVVSHLVELSGQQHRDNVVVIDEFDRISNDDERVFFADFIKQIGDRGIGIKFVFCGVGDSLEKLLGAHESCYRYLEGVELPRLSWDARWEIIDAAAEALNLAIPDRPRFRIAAISDGFPHYIHLVCEKLFWEVFEDPLPGPISAAHYTRAISAAVTGIEQHLKRAYDRAVMQDAGGFEEVLWAVADHADLFRSRDSIYESYLNIMRESNLDPLDRTAFTGRLRRLRSSGCGEILAANPAGWVYFRESIVRGYVRLRAEERGVELALELQPGKAQHSGWQRSKKKAGPPVTGRTYD